MKLRKSLIFSLLGLTFFGTGVLFFSPLKALVFSQETEGQLVSQSVTATESPLWEEGLRRTMQGDYKGAIRNFDDLIRLYPKFSDAYVNRGNLYAEEGDFSMAIADYTEALIHNPDNADAYYNRGVTYAEQGEFRLAIADFEQSLRIHPDDIAAYNNRGAVYSRLGEAEKAIEDYSQILLIDPSDPRL